MPTRYRRYLVPKGGNFSPSGAGIVKLLLELKKGRWLAAGGGMAKRVASPRDPSAGVEPIPGDLRAEWVDDADRIDLVLGWPVRHDPHEPGALRYPLTRVEDVPPPASFDFEIHRADDIVYPIAKGVGPIDSACKCGEELSFEWDADEVVSPFGNAEGIYTECEECSRTFDPALLEANILDPFTGTRSPVRGGAAYRFALVVDCGTAYPAGGAAPQFQPELKALVEAMFGRDFHEIGTLD